MREVFPYRYIKKEHSLVNKDLRYPIVATYRHPLDVLASFCQAQALKISDAELKKRVIELHRNGILDILEFKDNENVLLLRYELFSSNFDYLFDEVEKFFSIQILDALRTKLKTKYNIHNVKTTLMPSEKDFSYWDEETLFHGHHVSKFDGASYYFSEIFSQDQVDYLKKCFLFYMVEMGYE